MSLSLRYAARSHVGLIRDGNEDSGYAGPRLLVVADGMGGQAAGEVASSVVVQTMAQIDLPALDQSPVNPVRALTDRIHEAHERLRGIIAENPQLEGMGTTLTALLFAEGHLTFAHIGDSRAYRLRGGRLEQLTADHTWVQRLVDEGRISEEEAGHHPQRSLLMRALDGRGDAVDADLSVTDALPGDRLMLCSDGLSSFVSFDTLETALAGYADPHQAAEALIQLALRAGGPDNVTCIVADVLDSGYANRSPLSDAQTQYIDLPITVGAAAENRATGLPAYGAQPTVAPLPGVAGTRAEPDEIPQDTPAGRAARLRHPVNRDAASQAESPEAGNQESKRRRWVKPVGIGSIFVVILGAMGGGAYYWTQQQYFVAADNGRVAIYQGVNTSIGGLRLSHIYSTSPRVAVVSLPSASQSRVHDSIAATSLADAQSIVQTLSVLGAASATAGASPPASPSPSAPASPSPSARPSASTRASASGTVVSAAPATVIPPIPSVSKSVAGVNQLSAQCPGSSSAPSGTGSN
jgi:serine/threonine protein phosphatase PrpC